MLAVCDSLERLHGFPVTYLPVDRYGLVDPDAFEAAITPSTGLASIMHANNETGTVQPLDYLTRIAHDHGVLIHTDASQSAGKIPVHVDDLDVDLLTIAGHKPRRCADTSSPTPRTTSATCSTTGSKAHALSHALCTQASHLHVLGRRVHSDPSPAPRSVVYRTHISTP